MLSIKNKISHELKNELNDNNYSCYRVILHYKSPAENIDKKIASYKNALIHSIPSINCIAACLNPRAINRLTEYPSVDYITTDKYAYLCGSSVLSSNGIMFTNKCRFTGKGIGIGIVDTGVYPHPDLISKQNKIKKFEDIINEIRYPYDDNGHGTFVSGIIAGNGSLSKNMYKGIAESSHLYCIKAFNGIGKAFISDTLYAIDKLIEDSNEYNIKVICLPFETADNDAFILSLFNSLFKTAWDKNISVVVPAGQNGNEECSIRGISTLPNCITAGGLDTSSHMRPYKYSSGGPFKKLEKPDLSAACVNICSLNADINYISQRNGMKVYPQPLAKPYTCFTGTSCAAAYIAGICSLLYESKPDISCRDVISLLKTSCMIIDIPKWLQGAGEVDFNKLFSSIK